MKSKKKTVKIACVFASSVLALIVLTGLALGKKRR